ncbi:hypothetical protein K3148_01005 [Qipengyuania aurantiaca]|uniref:Uncharacterized protein n=1 Tax=Qipengyuania aurantiaca TaxID=2867233 RepID=A0ABX8ZM36_9SPHN|nr:hypothetical protein [Qipengyuania aurantiaca]QZD90024.1 hypothetical protein K3148_01005 [Qipengyuania aurantiaca]
MIAFDLGGTLAVYGYFGTLALMALQGGLVWLGAWALTRGRPRTHFLIKLCAVAVSWLGWVVIGATLAGFLGFLGLAMVVSVLPSGIYGSLLALVIWAVWDSDLDASSSARDA